MRIDYDLIQQQHSPKEIGREYRNMGEETVRPETYFTIVATFGTNTRI
jgi:hypothetical protein